MEHMQLEYNTSFLPGVEKLLVKATLLYPPNREITNCLMWCHPPFMTPLLLPHTLTPLSEGADSMAHICKTYYSWRHKERPGKMLRKGGRMSFSEGETPPD